MFSERLGLVPSLRDFQLKLDNPAAFLTVESRAGASWDGGHWLPAWVKERTRSTENESNVDSKTGQSASVSNGLSTVSSSSTPESSSKSTLASSSCRFLTTLGRTTLLTLLVGGGWFIWTTQQDKHPGQQLPFEEGKKTSILQPTQYLTRHKKRGVAVIEAEIKGVQENACFMKEIADAEKASLEFPLDDIGSLMQRRFMDCLESAGFMGQSKDEIDRLLHKVVVGGGPTGVELSGEIHDFLENDLKSWYPELASRIRIKYFALPSVLPTLSKQLTDYTESTFKESRIEILTGTMVKQVKPNPVLLQRLGGLLEVPCGMVVWAAGNKGRAVTVDLMGQTNRRGIVVDDYLRMVGTADEKTGTDKTAETDSKERVDKKNSKTSSSNSATNATSFPPGTIFAIGDCTATSYAPTAEVASQQGAYLGRLLKGIARKEALEARASETKANEMSQREGNSKANKDSDKTEQDVNKQLAKVKFRPFHYSHQGDCGFAVHEWECVWERCESGVVHSGIIDSDVSCDVWHQLWLTLDVMCFLGFLGTWHEALAAICKYYKDKGVSRQQADDHLPAAAGSETLRVHLTITGLAGSSNKKEPSRASHRFHAISTFHITPHLFTLLADTILHRKLYG
ncbi:hypothetical protein C8J56DRAFT_901229 [Mycena floridula]|nr:hypothetical protein C8J56DRAFT_901229 [Mycena floridula]